MNNTIKKVGKTAIYWLTFILMFVPDKLFSSFMSIPCFNVEINTIINKFILLLVLYVIIYIIYKLRNKIKIKGTDYIIEIKYGDILKEKNCKKVINFDECYTTEVGNLKWQIKPNSLCGQYLLAHPDLNIEELAIKNEIQKSKTKSLFKNKDKYDSGTIVPNGDDLLMAFAKLDEKGLGKFFSIQEYLDCLSLLWEQINEYYGGSDVCITILGSGFTRINGYSLNRQELLEKIILSYKLSPYKIKKPHKLKIICKKGEDFSINKVEGL